MNVYTLIVTDRFGRTSATSYRTESEVRIASRENTEIGDTFSIYRTWMA